MGKPSFGDADDGTFELPVPGRMRLRYLPGTGERLVVAFSGVGGGVPRVPEPIIEFRGSASDEGRNHVLFVTDPARTWLTGEGMKDALKMAVGACSRQLGTSSLTLLGNSMGAYAALRMASALRADSVLAIAPQVSPHQRHVPEERRWREFRQGLPVSDEDLIDEIDAESRLVAILHGDAPEEAIHAARFPRAKGLRHFVLPGGNHYIATRLKRRGALDRVVRTAIEGRPVKLAQVLRRQGFVPIGRTEIALPGDNAAIAA